MPCDYKNYPTNWKTEIRPAILERANNCCEVCGVKNGLNILRGIWNGIKCFQDENGTIYNEDTGEIIGDDYVGEVCKSENDKIVKIVLTIAHLDHDTTNNDYSNLKAMCQLHHLRYDKDFHAKNSNATRKRKKGIVELF